LTIPGFWAGRTYSIEWWDPYQPDPEQQIVGMEFLTAQPDGALTIEVDNFVMDLAVKALAVNYVYLPIILMH
jgi:hypothetical protein